MHKSISKTEHQKDQLKIKVKRLLRPVAVAFFFFTILPFFIILLFKLNVLISKGLLDPALEASVAKIIAKNGTGTAFLVSPTKLLTARHVVQGMNVGDDVQLIFEKAENKPQYKAKILYYPTSFLSPSENGQVSFNYFLSDYAVLEVSVIENITPLVLGESDIVKNLDEVILIGYPLGDYSITEGNINSDKYQGYDLFKLDASSNPGNSGGPLIHKADKAVIGILVGGGDPGLQGENVAVKINSIIQYLQSQGLTLF